jgi:hypothetical protein
MTQVMREPSAPPFRRPLVERLVGNRSVWSGYWSLVAHLAIGVILALMVCESRPERARARPIVIDGRGMRGDPADRQDGGESTVVVASTGPAAGEPADPETDPPPPTDTPPTVGATTGDRRATDVGEAVAAGSAPPTEDSLAIDRPNVAEGGPIAEEAGRPDRSSSAASGSEGFKTRRGDARLAAARRNGGTAASEVAVELGLAWLAAHQAVDGSWRCDLSGCRCDGACRDAGTIASTTASTAIALLPFLGAGHTHEDGTHQQTVSRGIYYLASRLKETPHGGDLCEGTMYGQGLATLVFAEAFGMTGDDLLRKPLADCIRFIETAQDQYSGGWRYLPGQPGDLTVTAWQIAALKSAQLSGLMVPSPAIDGAARFLDRVQSMGGAAYGYRAPSAKHSTSAIGLLCRMYTGWKPGDEPLDRGIERLASRPPDPNAIYENFYLAQVLMQADHPAWPRWNARLRDSLVRSQARVGHETGSWTFADRETAPGGRLAHTSLALLVLEVYYRLLPIYGEEAVAPGF